MSIPPLLSRGTNLLSDVERMTLLGFVAGHGGFTRDVYALDLRQFTMWCWQNQHQLFDVRRIDIECFARDLEERGKARATVARRLCTIVGFYGCAEGEGVIERPRRCTSADHGSTTSWTGSSSVNRGGAPGPARRRR